MGLFDKFKKKAAPASPSLTPPFPTQPDTTLKLLFSRQLPVEELTQAISRRFGSEAVARVDQLHPAAVCLLLRIDGVELWCSYMAFPLPPEEGDLRELLPHSLFVTPEEGEAMLGGKAFFVAGQKELGADLAGKRRACILLSRLCGALMELPEAQGCLNSGIGLLLGPRFWNGNGRTPVTSRPLSGSPFPRRKTTATAPSAPTACGSSASTSYSSWIPRRNGHSPTKSCT